MAIAPHAVHGQTLAGLNPLDWALVLMLGLSALTAFMRGLIRSLFSLVGVALGFVLAAWYAAPFAAWLGRWIAQPVLAEITAFTGILAAVYLAAEVLGRVLRSASHAVGLGLIDRAGGAVFGLARAVLVMAAVLVPVSPFLGLIPFTNDSVLLPYLRTAAHGVSFVVPQNFGKRLAAEAWQLPPTAAARRAHRVPRGGKNSAADSTDEGDAP